MKNTLNNKIEKINNQKTKQEQQNSCNILTMPSPISNDDISALFSGLISLVKKKCELDCKKEIINQNLQLEKLAKALKEKQAECNRLKNEILFLKTKI